MGPVAESAIVQGPSARATIQGPDGSVIAADQPGGAIAATARSGGIVAAGVAPAVVAHSAPILAASPGLIARVAAPAAIAGPALVSARLATAPIVAGHHGLVGAPLIARSGLLTNGLGYPLLAPGSGLEGQYLHDYTENLYDNGQYHGEFYH